MSLRETIRNLVPSGVRPRLRALMEPPGIETRVLRPALFVPDPDQTPRLSFILPSLSAKEAFGGVNTGLQYFLMLAAGVRADTGAQIRILTEEPHDPADSALDRVLSAADLQSGDVTIGSLAATGNQITTRACEIFMVYNWWISLNIEPVLREQANHFGQAPLPKLYIIQEYEPHFYPFSSAHLLALQAFNSSWPMWSVFNSSELANYYAAQGNVCARSYVFEPKLTPAIKAFHDGLSAGEKTKTVLVYGRPSIKRNCFSILLSGIKNWASAAHPGGDWRIVSAGTAHKGTDLGNGYALTSLGKLSLENYGQLLRKTAIGVSLMSSPHPSYPPLEMAHFGIRTITNNYPGKDLSKRHDNIHPLADVMPATLGTALAREMAAFEADPGAGLRAASHIPSYLSDVPFDCLAEMTRDVVEVLEDRV